MNDVSCHARRIRWSWLVGALLAACASQGVRSGAADTYAATARAAVEQSDFARAIDLYDLAVSELRFPRDGSTPAPDSEARIALWRTEQARPLLEAGNAARAIACVDEALALESGRALAPTALADAYANRGLARAALGQRDAALADLGLARRAGLDSARLRALEDQLTERPATLQRAQRALQAGDWGGAEREFGAALAVRADIEALEGRGTARLMLNRPAEALADLDAAVKLAPASAQLRLRHAGALQVLGRHPDAIAELTQLIEPGGVRKQDAEPSIQMALLGRGSSFTRLQPPKLDAALADFDRVIAANPRGPDAYVYRAQVLYAQGEIERAHGDLARAQELGSPQAAETRRLMDLALGLTSGGGEQEQPDDPEELDDDFFDAWLDELDAGGTAEPSAGESVAQFGARLGWNDTSGLEAGYAEFVAGRTEAARAAWSAVADRAPRRPAPHYFVGLALARLGRSADAEAAYARAIELAPTNASARMERAVVRERLGTLETALEDWNKALELAPSSAEAWARRGALLDERGDLAGAVRDYTRALELDPGQAWVVNACAWIKITSEDAALYDAAGGLALAKRLLELAPTDPACLDTLACAHAANGDFESATRIETRALELCKADELRRELELNQTAFRARKSYRDRVRAERGIK